MKEGDEHPSEKETATVDWLRFILLIGWETSRRAEEKELSGFGSQAKASSMDAQDRGH